MTTDSVDQIHSIKSRFDKANAEKGRMLEGLTDLSRRMFLSIAGGTLGGQFIGGAAVSVYMALHPLSEEINAIATQIIRRKAAIGRDDILFVPMGEDHTQPIHKIVMQGVISRLRQSGIGVAVGMELSQDTLPNDILAQQYETPYLREDEKGNYGFTPDRAQRASQTLDYLHGRIAFRQFMGFLYNEAVPFEHNDLNKVWRDMGNFLDPDDARARGLARAHKADVKSGIKATSREGMYLRNIAMADNAYQHAYGLKMDGNAPVEVYIQHCGAAHLTGDTFECPFEESLGCQLKDMGADVFCVDLSGYQLENLSPPAKEFVDSGYGMSQKVTGKIFNYEADDPEKADAFRFKELDETAYIKQLCDRAGVNFYAKGLEPLSLERKSPIALRL